MQLQPHDLHICPYSHGTSCVFQPNADQMLDGTVDKIRRRGDKSHQAAGQRAQRCGREMHTSGPIDRQKEFKFVCSWSIKSFFEQFASHDLAGQAACAARFRHSARHCGSKMLSFRLAPYDSSCILTFAFNGELSEWPKEHDWKSCRRQKRLQGSNPDSPPVNSKAGLRACFVFTPRGGVAEWLNAAVSKTVWPV